MVLTVSIDLSELDIKSAFHRYSTELMINLESLGISGEFAPNGHIFQGNFQIGSILEWKDPEFISMEWWLPETRGKEFVTKFQMRFHSLNYGKGTKITVENEGWENVLRNTGSDVTDWFISNIVGNLLQATSPGRYSTWLIDRYARRPSGALSRNNYEYPIYHIPNFVGIFSYLKLTPEDYLLEVGCGGGYFLKEALKSGCRAAAIDHSLDMISVASAQNSKAVEEGRLVLNAGDAEKLPFADGAFTCIVCTGVFNFIRHPEIFLTEVYRVLGKGGRFILFVGSKELRGTPAAPDPIAEDKIQYYEDDELRELARNVGFRDARIERPDLLKFAIEAKIPVDALEFFRQPGGGGQFLIAVKE